MTTDWKQHHANEADKALGHPLVAHVIDEQMDNLGTDSALVRYGLTKIAHYAAMVARAQAYGIDPDLFRLTATEANSELLRVAAEATLRGVPTFLIGPEPSPCPHIEETT